MKAIVAFKFYLSKQAAWENNSRCRTHHSLKKSLAVKKKVDKNAPMLTSFYPSPERTNLPEQRTAAPARLPIFSLPYHFYQGTCIFLHVFLVCVRNWKVVCFAGRSM
jgi:hypothetical protein